MRGPGYGVVRRFAGETARASRFVGTGIHTSRDVPLMAPWNQKLSWASAHVHGALHGRALLMVRLLESSGNLVMVTGSEVGFES